MLEIICTLIVAIVTPLVAVFAYRDVIEKPRRYRALKPVDDNPHPGDVINRLKVQQLEDILTSSYGANYPDAQSTLLAVRAVIDPNNTHLNA